MKRKQLLSESSIRHCQPLVILERFAENRCSVFLKPLDISVRRNRDIDTTSEDTPWPHHSSSTVKVHNKRSPAKLTQKSFLEKLSLHPKSDPQLAGVKQSEIKLSAVSSKRTRRRTVSETSEDSLQTLSTLYGAKSGCYMLSPIATRCKTIDSMCPDDESVVSDSSSLTESSDSTSDILEVDLTSPLGKRLSPLLQRTRLKGVVMIKDYDKYCNQTEVKTTEDRNLRSKALYCDDSWSMNNIHYVRLEDHNNINRTYCFGRRARLERYKTLKVGLNKRSRQLLRLIQRCSVPLERYNLNGHGIDSPIHLNSEKVLTSPQTLHVTTDHQQAVIKDTYNMTDLCRSQDTTNAAIRKALAPILADNPSTCRCETPPGCQLNQGNKDNSTPVSWKDLVFDPPTLAAETIDLTGDSDDEVTFMLPSPTILLSTPPPTPPSESMEEYSSDMGLIGNWYNLPSDMDPFKLKKTQVQQCTKKSSKRQRIGRVKKRKLWSRVKTKKFGGIDYT